jgi:hypothetical protein
MRTALKLVSVLGSKSFLFVDGFESGNKLAWSSVTNDGPRRAF